MTPTSSTVFRMADINLMFSYSASRLVASSISMAMKIFIAEDPLIQRMSTEMRAATTRMSTISAKDNLKKPNISSNIVYKYRQI